jgi:hypothetical protein
MITKIRERSRYGRLQRAGRVGRRNADPLHLWPAGRRDRIRFQALAGDPHRAVQNVPTGLSQSAPTAAISRGMKSPKKVHRRQALQLARLDSAIPLDGSDYEMVVSTNLLPLLDSNEPDRLFIRLIEINGNDGGLFAQQKFAFVGHSDLICARRGKGR